MILGRVCRGYLLSYEYCENMNKLIFLEQYWKKNEINFDNVEKRLIDFSKKYYVTEFSTHRTKEFIEDVKESEKIENRHIGEYIRCFNFIGRGKSKFVDCPYLLRIHHKKRGIRYFSFTLRRRWVACRDLDCDQGYLTFGSHLWS